MSLWKTVGHLAHSEGLRMRHVRSQNLELYLTYMVLRRRLLVGLPVLGLLAVACADLGDDGSNLSQAVGAAKDVCKVVKTGEGAGARMKVLKGTVLGPEREFAGEVVIDGANIVCVAESCDRVENYAAATRIECTNAVISPGLINTHEHITFANIKPHTPSEERYEHRHDWRKGARGHTKISSFPGKPTEAHIQTAELRFLMSGVTSLAGSGGAPGLIRNLDNMPDEREGAKIALVNSDTFPLSDNDGNRFPEDCAGFKPSRRKTEQVANYASYLPHVAEGVDVTAHQEMVCQSGGPMSNPRPEDASYDIIQKQTAVIHGVAVNADEVNRFRQDQAILIWSPRSNVDLYGNTAPIALYANLGVPIALGTDWLPSGSMNMARELRCADELNTQFFHGVLSDRQLWQSVTEHAAMAVRGERVIGALKPGLLADVAIYENTGKPNGYRAVIEAGVEDTVLVLRGGRALYGDAKLVKDAAAGGDPECEDFEVCGVAKAACVKKDVGKYSLRDLMNYANVQYPLFACRGQVPDREPSCFPKRPPTASSELASTYEGPTDADKDGDGVPNASDNCPDVFNPIRPMDNGQQPDTDGDGIGDACDPCPLDANPQCTRQPNTDPDDVDNDGKKNWEDNCPDDFNPDQKDEDRDGKGAACDFDAFGQSCDDVSNPGGFLCTRPFTIKELRDRRSERHPKKNNVIRADIRGVYVTAISNNRSMPGYFIQDGTDEYSGMFVATRDTQRVKVGNKVDIKGDYAESRDIDQLSEPFVTVVDPGTQLPFEPVKLTPAQVGHKKDGEPWESMLVTLEGPLKVTSKNADAVDGGTKDFDEFTLGVGDASVRVDDQLCEGADNVFDEGMTFTQITGIATFSFENRKIWPRDAADYNVPAGAPAIDCTPPKPPPPGDDDDNDTDPQDPNNPPPSPDTDPGDHYDDLFGPPAEEAPVQRDPEAEAKRKKLQSRQSCSAAAGPADLAGLAPFAAAALLFARRRRSKRES